MKKTKNKAGVKPKIMVLKELSDYREDAIVSRTISDRKTGTVTFFAFDKGQGLSEHTAPYDALVYVLDGKVDITVDGKPHRIKAGELIIMPARHPHSLAALTRFKMLLIMIRS